VVETISNWLRIKSTGWIALAALILFLLFSAIVLPRQAATTERETGGSASPDTSFVYTASDLYEIAESYGEQGREAYVRARFTFDLVWPLVYTLFLATGISWVFGKAFASDSAWQLANLTPFLAAGFDFLENVSTALVMLRYPDQTALVDLLAPVFTLLKWSLLGASFVLLIGASIYAFWHWAKQRVRAARSG
jgi:hypothetical protein